MYKIKDNLTRLALNVFFSDKEIDAAYKKQEHDKTNYVLLQKFNNTVNITNISININKNQFKKVEYNPNDWNKLYEVTPPSVKDKKYLIFVGFTPDGEPLYVFDTWNPDLNKFHCYSEEEVKAYREVSLPTL